MSMTFAGSFGVPRRHADITFPGAPFTARVPAGGRPLMAGVGIGGVLAATAVFLFVAIAVVSVFFGKPLDLESARTRHAGHSAGHLRLPPQLHQHEAAAAPTRGRTGHGDPGRRLPRRLRPLLLHQLEDPVDDLEDRLRGAVSVHSVPAPRFSPFAAAAFAGWLAVTATWWALAFAPLPVPDAWLAAARAVCFGTLPNGLPDTWGWMLLVLGPLSMLAFLLAVWGREVGSSGRWLAAVRAGSSLSVVLAPRPRA
jgi:hypothetical protein